MRSRSSTAVLVLVLVVLWWYCCAGAGAGGVVLVGLWYVRTYVRTSPIPGEKETKTKHSSLSGLQGLTKHVFKITGAISINDVNICAFVRKACVTWVVTL